MEMQEGTRHTLSLDNRERTVIEGMKSVISFDEGEVILETVVGRMRLEGTDLQVKTVNMQDGILVVEGKVDGIGYTDTATNDAHQQPRRHLFG